MAKHRVGGTCCPAGKVKPKFPDMPLLSAYYAAVKLAKDKLKPAWKLSNATVGNRRVLIGNGNIAAEVPRSSAAWEASPAGKRRSRAEKRAAKARKERV